MSTRPGSSASTRATDDYPTECSPASPGTEAAFGAFRMPPLALAAGVVVVLGVALASSLTGAAELSRGATLRTLAGWLPLVDHSEALSASHQSILTQIRLPRMVLGMLVGASLSMSGASYQGVFHNPLADPYLLGVSSGAGFGATLALGLGVNLGWGPIAAVPAAAFAGAVIAVAASAIIARGAGNSPATLLLGGVAMAALFSAGQTYVLLRLSQAQAREVLSWLFGQLNTSGWDQVVILGPYTVICGALLIAHRRHLDVLRVGDEEAMGLGLNPARSRVVILIAASLMTAAAVAVSGLIAFVGLVVPHLVRLVVSSSYRIIVPLSALVGAGFLGLVDMGARTLISPAELPVGVLTALVGAPFFVLVLMRGQAHSS